MTQAGERRRDARFDILKGIAILAVVIHHVTGFALGSKWHGSDYSTALEYINRAVRFAVPTFILVSVYLVGRGIAARSEFSWKPYLAKRLQGTVYPYLVWTLLYLGLHGVAARNASPLAAMGFKSLEPVSIFKSLGWILAFGKASFHLYFLAALFQIQLVLPWVIRIGRRILGAQLAAWLVAGAVIQVGIYIVHHAIGAWFWSRGMEPPLPPFSSMVYGYALPLMLGAGMAVCDAPGAEIEGVGARSWTLWLLPIVIYVPYAVNDVNASYPLLQEGLFMAFSTASGAALISACGDVHGKAARVLEFVGLESLGIYLVHPIFLEAMRSRSALLGRLPLPEVWLFAATLAGSAGLLWFLRVCHLNRILFGRVK